MSKRTKLPGWLYPVIAVVVSLAAMAPTLSNGWTNWDDPGYVLENSLMQQPASEAIATAFSRHLMGNYHPLTELSLWQDYQLGGDNAAWYHRTNLFWHLLSVLLVFWLAKLLVRNQLAALFVALLFGVHPMHVEPVAWISGRKDVLYGALYLAAMLAWWWYRERKRKPLFYAIAFLLFAASLLSKSMAVVLPVSLLLLDYVRDKRFTRISVLEKLPFFGASLVVGLVTFFAQADAGAVAASSIPHPIDAFFTACYNLTFYAVAFAAPLKLSPHHPFPTEPGTIPGYFYAALVPVAAMIWAAWKWGRTRPVILFGIGFYIVNLALVLQFLSVGSALSGERYTYIAYLGPLLLLGFGLTRLLAGTMRTPTIVVCSAFCGILAVTSSQHSKSWESGEALWTQVIAEYPNDFMAYGKRAEVHQANRAGDLALADLNATIRLNPRYAKSWNNRALVHKQRGDQQAQLRDLREALRLDPTLVEAHINLGVLYLNQQQLDAADAAFTKVIELAPANGLGYLNRGLVRQRQNRLQEALSDLERGVQLMPDFQPGMSALRELRQQIGQ